MDAARLFTIHFCLITTSWVQAQLLDANIQHPLNLSDDVRIILIPSADEPTRYYYIPQTIQVSINKGIPEASLLFYRGTDNSIEGGILHILLTWGLTPEQESIARQHLLKIDSSAVLMGGAELLFQDDDQLIISPDNSLSRIFQRASTSAIRISPQNFSKTAASFRFTGDDAMAIHKAIREKPKGQNSLSISYEYRVARYSGYMRVGSKKMSTMQASIDQWLRTLVKYNLIKYTSI